MSTAGVTHSNNGNGSHEWALSWTQLTVDRRSPGYCRVTFDHPPINTLTATMVGELSELVDLIEADEDLNVVVFDSANPDFYLAHCDSEDAPDMRSWLDLLVRLSRAPCSASLPSGAALAALGASSCSRAICGSRHARTPCSACSRWGSAWCMAAVRWHGSADGWARPRARDPARGG